LGWSIGECLTATHSTDAYALAQGFYHNYFIIAGIEVFLAWCNKIIISELSINYTIEATGVYYEGLAFFLYDKEKTCHVLLPNKAKKFAESLNLKSKTDKIAAKMLARMGVERLLVK